MSRALSLLLAAAAVGPTAAGPGGGNVSLVPFSNCTKIIGETFCYEGAEADVMTAGQLDPLTCKIAGFQAHLVQGNCSAAGFGDYKGNDPVFKKVGLWFKTKETASSAAAAAITGGEPLTATNDPVLAGAAAVPQTENAAPEKHYVCEGANPDGYGGRCVEKLLKGLDLANCQAVCAPPPPPVNFSCTGATAFATKKVCDFVSQWNDADVPKGAMISLICTPEEQCTISGTKLGANTENGRETDFGFQGDATMTNVLVKDMSGNKTFGVDNRGGLMEVGSAGRVVGTNIIFRNGLVKRDGGGCVYTKGNFACTDCTFDKCITSAGFGGGIESGGGGALKLVRPTFTNSACALGSNCGSGCSCDGDDHRGQGMNASLCVGCTCKKTENLAFYCDSN